MLVMSRNTDNTDGESPKRANRSGVPLNTWVDKELAATLDLFIKSQEVEPTTTAIVKKALREFFQRKGLLPGPANPADKPTTTPAPAPVPVALTPVPRSALCLPLLGHVPAGPPQEVFEQPDEWFDFDERFAGEGRYMLRVRGDSMEDEKIFSGDIAVIRTFPEAKPGDAVVAMKDGEMTMKKLIRQTAKEIRLQARDGSGQTFVLDKSKGDRVLGVYVGAVRMPK